MSNIMSLCAITNRGQHESFKLNHDIGWLINESNESNFNCLLLGGKVINNIKGINMTSKGICPVAHGANTETDRNPLYRLINRPEADSPLKGHDLKYPEDF